MSSYLVNPARYTPDFNRSALTDFNTDLFPRDDTISVPLPRSHALSQLLERRLWNGACDGRCAMTFELDRVGQMTQKN